MGYKERLKKLLLGTVNDIPFTAIDTNILNYNRIIAMTFSIFAFVLISIMLGISLLRQEFESSKVIYIVGILVSILIFILAFKKKNKVYIWTAVYIAENFFLIYGLSIGLLSRPNTQTTTFMVLLVLLPIIFVDRPIVTNFILFLYVVIFSIGAYFLKIETIKYVDIVDALIFGLLAIISGTTVNYIRIKEFILEDKLKEMSEIDQLTGLKNRNSFEWNLVTIANTQYDKIACVYIDVNGLHQLNNTKGHKAGDIMLQFIAKEIQNRFGVEHTYRIGGDEYVFFVFNNKIDNLFNLLFDLKSKIIQEGYAIAIGYAIQDQEIHNINNLIKDAEYRMYKNKNDYYIQKGITR